MAAISQTTFSNAFSWMEIYELRINNNPALVQIMDWRRPGAKPLSEPMLVSLLTHTCITRPQWDTSLHNIRLRSYMYYIVYCCMPKNLFCQTYVWFFHTARLKQFKTIHTRRKNTIYSAKPPSWLPMKWLRKKDGPGPLLPSKSPTLWFRDLPQGVNWSVLTEMVPGCLPCPSFLVIAPGMIKDALFD